MSTFVVKVLDKYQDGLEGYLKSKKIVRGEVQYTSKIEEAAQFSSSEEAVIVGNLVEDMMRRTLCLVEMYGKMIMVRGK
jgi:hypothetical protein